MYSLTWQCRIVHLRIYSYPFCIYVMQIYWRGIQYKILMHATAVAKLVCEPKNIYCFSNCEKLWMNASRHHHELRVLISPLSTGSCLNFPWLNSINVCSDIMAQDTLYNILKEMGKMTLYLSYILYTYIHTYLKIYCLSPDLKNVIIAVRAHLSFAVFGVRPTAFC